MIKAPLHLIANCLSCFFCSVVLIFVFSCSSQGDSENSIEKLTAYCVRECVVETGDPESCDTGCRCASEKLSSEYSNGDFAALVQAITQGKSESQESWQELANSLKSCKD